EYEPYVVGHDKFSDTFMQGMPALLLSLITGNWYNVQERYGAQGFEPLREALRSDKAFLDIVTGAAGSTLRNTFGRTDGMLKAIMSMVKQDGNFKLTLDDFVDPFREISSVNNTSR